MTPRSRQKFWTFCSSNFERSGASLSRLGLVLISDTAAEDSSVVRYYQGPIDAQNLVELCHVSEHNTGETRSSLENHDFGAYSVSAYSPRLVPLLQIRRQPRQTGTD